MVRDLYQGKYKTRTENTQQLAKQEIRTLFEIIWKNKCMAVDRKARISKISIQMKQQWLSGREPFR